MLAIKLDMTKAAVSAAVDSILRSFRILQLGSCISCPSSLSPSTCLAAVPHNCEKYAYGFVSHAHSIRARQLSNEKSDMLYTIAIVLVVLWLLGLVTSYTLGGFVHILLVIAVVVILVRVIQGRRL